MIWFTLILVLSVFGGGLYFAVSRPPFPFPISTQENTWQGRLRFWFSYKFIASGLARAAQESNEDMSQWEHVEVYYSQGDWNCLVWMKGREGSMFIIVPRDSDPELQKNRWSEPPIIK